MFALLISLAHAGVPVGGFGPVVPACNGGLMDDALTCADDDSCHGGWMDAFPGMIVAQPGPVQIPTPNSNGVVDWPYDVAHFACTTYPSGGGVDFVAAGTQAPVIGFNQQGAWISWDDMMLSMFPVSNRSLCNLPTQAGHCYKVGYHYIGVEAVDQGYVFSIL